MAVTLVSVVLSVAITAGFAIALSFPGIGTLVALSIAFAVPTMVDKPGESGRP